MWALTSFTAKKNKFNRIVSLTAVEPAACEKKLYISTTKLNPLPATKNFCWLSWKHKFCSRNRRLLKALLQTIKTNLISSHQKIWWKNSFHSNAYVFTHRNYLSTTYHRFRWYATLENKTPAEMFPKLSISLACFWQIGLKSTNNSH